MTWNCLNRSASWFCLLRRFIDVNMLLEKVLTLFTSSFLACVAMKRDTLSTSKIVYQWDFPQRSMYFLSPLLFCFRVGLVSRDMTMESFLWPLHANYLNQIYNINTYSTCLPKIIWDCLHWCNLCISSQSLLYLKQKKQQITCKFNFCWEILDLDQVSNMAHKETKVINIGFLFGFYYYNYFQNVI